MRGDAEAIEAEAQRRMAAALENMPGELAPLIVGKSAPEIVEGS